MNISRLYAAPFFVDHHAHDHTHDPGVSSVSIVCEGEMDLEKASFETIPHLLLYFSIDKMNIETSNTTILL
jgi:hypothetical protein